MDIERIRNQSPYRRAPQPQQQQQQQRQFVTSLDANDADDDDDIVTDSVEDRMSRDRPRRQIPSVSPSRRQQRIGETRAQRRTGTETETGNDVVTTTTTTQRRQRQSVRLSRCADDTGRCGAVDGHDTGLGSISLDENCSDDDDDDDDTVNTESILHGLAASSSFGEGADFRSEQSMDGCRHKLALIDGEMERQIDARFRETMANITADVQRNQRTVQDNFDNESVQTDDIEHEFRKTLISLEILPPPIQTRKSAASSPQLSKTVPVSIAAVTRDERRHDGPPSVDRDRLDGGSSTVSVDNDSADEAENASVKTEDFEAQFHHTTSGGSGGAGTIAAKQVAHTPVPTFDPFIVDSDLETVQSQLVRDTFQMALARNDQGNGTVRRPLSGYQRKTSTVRRKRDASPSSDVEADVDDMRRSELSRSLMDDIENWKRALQHQPVPAAARCSSAERPRIVAARTPVLPRRPATAFASCRTLPTKAKLSNARQVLDNKTDFEVSCRLKQELAKVQSQLKQALHTKQAVQQTSDRLQALASQHQADVLATEKRLKESRASAEFVRSELMRMELKRDAASRELESLTAEVDNRRLQLQRLAVHEKATADDQLSVSDAQSNVDTTEGRQQMELKLTELQQQNGQLQSEKADAKLQADKLQEELQKKEIEFKKVENVKEQLGKKIADLEALLQKTEAEKREFMQKSHEELETTRGELVESREKFSREVAELKVVVGELTNRLGASHQENCRKDEINNQLREELDKHAHELAQQNVLHNNLLEENICSLRGIIKEKEMAVNAAIEEAKEAKRVALEENSRVLNADHARSLKEQEQHFTDQLTALRGQLSGKEIELQVLRDKMQEQEDWMNQMSERIQQENHEKMQEALEDERSRVEAEKNEQLNTQLESMKVEMVRSGRQLREELQREKDAALTYRQQIDTLEQELEKVRESCRSVYRETLQSEFDDRVQQRKQSTDKLHYQEMLEQKTEKLNEVVQKQREEMERLRQENTQLNAHWQERIAAIDRSDRRLDGELKEQCDRIAAALNEPATITAAVNCSVDSGQSSSRNSTASRSRSPSRRTQRTVDTRSSLTSSATNLANWCEKLRDRLAEQQQQIEEHNATIARINKSVRDDIETLKTQLQEDKYQALETLKNRLIKEHLEEVEKLHKSFGRGKGLHSALREKDRELQKIQQNMKAWKNQTLEKLAQKFKEEMNRELMRRDLKQSTAEMEKVNLTVEQTTRPSSTPHIIGNKHSVQHSSAVRSPQNFLSTSTSGRHLTSTSADRQPLVEKLGASVPDLTAIGNTAFARHMTRSTSRYAEHSSCLPQVRQLQLQAQRAEANWKMADERARSNEHLLNQKMIELAELQSLVTQQTKELAQLQRAYSKLQNRAAAFMAATGTTSTKHHRLQTVN